MSRSDFDSAPVMTRSGYDKLTAELIDLRSNGRAEISRQLEEARSFGDLSENAEYSAAKDEQSKLEARISWLEYQLSKAKVIDASDVDTSRVTLGTTVTIEDTTHQKVFTYTLVGSEEADPKTNRISSSSPVGKALFGKTVGEEILVKVPRGIRSLRIVSIAVM
ncbi:MAG: transcription elongation factor GreA [Aminobacterium sp.]|uniref:transcription elongation factor GreA n=1 Tax=unclassified Aminobacterium TaxID=2685012 RepID=UPI0027DD4621|nr:MULTISPECIES: transcription elongation factor GreA [unclassified Aminobacterium]MDD2206222.1 transcription elongation factor GreA [Aminobacterium sp.]MDD3427247.1 transcription elongation factor GreA [Aminobacterium sp.]MDD3707660.1 transcription elongation factor GreA [Aminobacterium sp.]MDD4227934.1 transcription elongation factor GreA [Aminobacterium sp.]MDD4551219.1 transcription elongation factor GreA [Aminobacterium sp.]